MGIIERKEREREARRNQILDAAQKVFGERGTSQATMEEIAQEAELAKGTIYLYYKNKEELLVGLILRGFEILGDMCAEWTDRYDRGLDKLRACGDAYRQFSFDNRFLFSLMNVSEPPGSANISRELIDDLTEVTSLIWARFVRIAEQAQAEGDLKTEVNGFTFVMTLWLSLTGVLRMYNKCLLSEHSVYNARTKGFRINTLDWKYMYDHTCRMLLETVVTDQGRAALPPLVWRSAEEIGMDFTPDEMQAILSADAQPAAA